MKKPIHRSVDDFLHFLDEQNKPISEWAKEHGFSLDAVYAVTRGKARGKRGAARRVFLAMGVKPAAAFEPKAAA